MQNLFDFLRRWNYAFLFVVLEAVSGVLLFRFNHYQGSVYLSAANEVNAHINEAYSYAESYLHLGTDNKDLTAENVRLAKENEILRQQLATLKHTPNQIELGIQEYLAQYEQIPAIVVGNDVQTSRNYIVINRGTHDGVKPEMGVVSGQGVVGIVYLCGENHSLVMPLINPKSNISCRIRGQEYFGFLKWNERNSRKAFLEDIPRYAKIKAGMTVETSGYSAVFPPGLYVGKVTNIANSTDGQSYSLGINLGTDFTTLRHVMVISTPYKAEIDTLRSKIQD